MDVTFHLLHTQIAKNAILLYVAFITWMPYVKARRLKWEIILRDKIINNALQASFRSHFSDVHLLSVKMNITDWLCKICFKLFYLSNFYLSEARKSYDIQM